MALPQELLAELHDAALHADEPQSLARAADLVDAFAQESDLTALEAALTAGEYAGVREAAEETTRRLTLLEEELARFLACVRPEA